MAKKKAKRKIRKTLADTIRAEIKRQELTAYRLSKDSGVADAVIHRFIKGERDLRLETAEPICKVLGLSLTRDDIEEE